MGPICRVGAARASDIILCKHRQPGWYNNRCKTWLFGNFVVWVWAAERNSKQATREDCHVWIDDAELPWHGKWCRVVYLASESIRYGLIASVTIRPRHDECCWVYRRCTIVHTAGGAPSGTTFEGWRGTVIMNARLLESEHECPALTLLVVEEGRLEFAGLSTPVPFFVITNRSNLHRSKPISPGTDDVFIAVTVTRTLPGPKSSTANPNSVFKKPTS